MSKQKTPATKNPVGRPSKFDTIDKKQLKVLVQKGFTTKEIAEFFSINPETFFEYLKTRPEFSNTLKDWKQEADEKVEKCLYQRAIGYEYDEVVYEKSAVGGLGLKLSDDEIKEIKHVNTNKVKITVKKVLPDVTAQIFWLKNRKPKEWRDKHDFEVPDIENILKAVRGL